MLASIHLHWCVMEMVEALVEEALVVDQALEVQALATHG